MRIFDVGYELKHPGSGATPANSLTTGNAFSQQFLVSKFTQSPDMLIPHVGSFTVTLKGGTLRQAAGAPGVLPTDYIRLLANVVLEANGRKPMDCFGITALRCMQAIASNTDATTLAAIGVNIAANGGGGNVDTAVEPTFTFQFIGSRLVNPAEFLLPLSWWRPGTWTFNFADPATVFDPGVGRITWLVLPTSCELTMTSVISPHFIVCPPFEIREVSSTANLASTNTGELALLKNQYLVLGYTSPKFGGYHAGDDLADVLASLYTNQMLYRTPQSWTAYQQARHQLRRGWAPGTPFSIDLSNAPGTSNNRLAAWMLAGPRGNGHFEDLRTNQMNVPPDTSFNAAVASGKSLSERHLLWFIRGSAMDPCGWPGIDSALADSAKAVGCNVAGFAPWQPLIHPLQATPAADEFHRYPQISRRVSVPG